MFQVITKSDMWHFAQKGFKLWIKIVAKMYITFNKPEMVKSSNSCFECMHLVFTIQIMNDVIEAA